MRRLGILLLTLLLAGCTVTSRPPAPPLGPPPDSPPSDSPPPEPVGLAAVVLSQLAMVDPSNGWAVGWDAKKSMLVLLRTRTGGESWEMTRLPQLPAPSNLPGLKLVDIVPFGPTRAVLAVRKGEQEIAVLRTGDGGFNWEESLLEVEPWETGGVHLAFAGEQEGWLLLTSDPALGSMRKSVFRSSDGGQSWTGVARATEPPTEGALPAAEYVTGISARDGSHAWVGRTYRSEDSVLLHETTDGGQSWSQRSLPYPKDLPQGMYANTFPPLYFGPDRQRGVAVVELPGIAGATTLYLSSDGGRSWEPGTGVAALSLQDYSFSDPENGWLLQRGGARLCDTADGGRTWNEWIDPNQERPRLKEAIQLQFVDAATGWALLRLESGQSQVLKSTDRGATWVEQPLVLDQACDCR